MSSAPIVVAGPTGQLGRLITQELLGLGAPVRVLVRPESDPAKVSALRAAGAEVVTANPDRVPDLIRAVEGAACVVSALSGLRAVIVDVQTRLLDAAVEAGVPRFIPSDFSVDFTRPGGRNRNLDLRREFRARLDAVPIQATSVLNGMFADLLTGQAPVVLPRLRRVLYWGDADQPLDFTTVADTAAFTARVALDPAAPRWLRVAGDVQSARGLQAAASAATGQPFGLLRAGGTGSLHAFATLTRALTPPSDEVFPAWQGMQYLHDMFTGQAKLTPLDNGRYPALRWTGVAEVLKGL
ncbi:NmrA family NAD(P)-binding protein [Deinococcus sp. HMF7604]|uniref:NmrA family NAD(P)-binding protein n=1 Tax=Deinococcus betulae TaxID=2873312 RepID=UPI001CCAC37B|nr:NmrA family NAD(P)-binding protein [Deinococcus betulae]MBZ9751476.1 NmrA family NAD(P)-binding protein [Deinococcus betulae]